MNPEIEQLKNKSLFKEQAYIDGQWVASEDGEVLDVDNPASNAKLGSVPSLTLGQVKQAVDSANRAYPEWRKKLAKERADILRRWYNLLLEYKEDLAILLTLEQGKPFAEAMGEMDYGNSFVEWFAEEARRIYGDTIPQHEDDRRVMALREPVGVCAAITPWNFPNAMITRKVAPALAAGCTIIVKPPSETPFSALALAELAERAGVPKGVFNVVTGKSSVIGGELTSNPIVRKLSFTGSTPIGSLLMSQCAPTVKNLSLELGGNAPLIIFDDADMDTAVEGALIAKYRNTGQSCIGANRIFVHDGIYDEFTERFSEAVKSQMTLGNGLDKGVVIGPMINRAAVAKVEEHIKQAVDNGARITVGGEARLDLGENFFPASVLADVSHDMQVAHEETFGPLAALIRFKTEDEVISMANDTEFGLAAYIFTQNLGRTYRVMEALEYGVVGVNTGKISNATAPFGGMKSSGLGREGSKYGLDEYLEMKYVCLAGIEQG